MLSSRFPFVYNGSGMDSFEFAYRYGDILCRILKRVIGTELCELGVIFVRDIKRVGYALRAPRMVKLGDGNIWKERLDEDAVFSGEGGNLFWDA